MTAVDHQIFGAEGAPKPRVAQRDGRVGFIVSSVCVCTVAATMLPQSRLSWFSQSRMHDGHEQGHCVC